MNDTAPPQLTPHRTISTTDTDVLVKAAGRWLDELHEYVIPASEDAEDTTAYMTEARIIRETMDRVLTSSPA